MSKKLQRHICILITLLSTENGDIRIGVKNTFYVKQLRARYLDIIATALKNNGLEINSIDFEVKSTTKPKARSREVTKTDELIKKRIQTIKTEKSTTQSNGLNPKYTLDTFVVGSNNDLAFGAARSIIDAPGSRYNPFFLYDGPGLGKTHLVQAIGNELLKNLIKNSKN